jgi:hypothetical protein
MTLKLEPVFDYVMGIQMGQGGIQKIPALTPLDILSEMTPTYVIATGVTFFADMQESDQERYKNMVAGARDQMEQVRIRKNTGIQLVTNLPPTNTLRG